VPRCKKGIRKKINSKEEMKKNVEGGKKKEIPLKTASGS
jgi:hypothetical protein